MATIRRTKYILICVVAVLLPLSYTSGVNEGKSLPINDPVEPTTCPVVPSCNCQCAPCAPVITLSCPASSPPTCTDPPTPPPPTERPNPTRTTRPRASTTPESSPIPPEYMCQDIFSSDFGGFSSPNYPNNYPDYANSCWLITATGPIVISFTDFSLESCCDWVTIYDGPTSSSPLLSRFSSISSPVYSTSNQVLVTFTSDGSVTSRGFNATFSVTDEIGSTTARPTTTSTDRPSESTHEYPETTYSPDPSGLCQTVLISSDSGWFTSPNFPSNYPDFANFCWLITATSPIAISFTDFALETNWDWVTIYDGPTSSSPLLSRSSSIPSPVNSTSNQVLVTFTSDGSVTSRGFNATFSATGISSTATTHSPVTQTPPPTFVCQTVLSSDSGWFSSPNYPNPYPNNANSCWLIAATRPVVISFTSFALEGGFDLVTIYNGPTNSSTLLSRLSSDSIPSPVYATSNQVLVTFTSDYSVTLQGFNATFSATGIRLNSPLLPLLPKTSSDEKIGQPTK